MTNNEEKGYCAKTTISWYPGHMAKAKRQIKEKINLIDLIYEVIDARDPYSSKIKDIDDIVRDKKRILLISKKDLCDINVTKKWVSFYEKKGYNCLLVNFNDHNDYKKIMELTKKVCKDLLAKRVSKGLINMEIRALVIGVPNVGKSTFINLLVGKNVAQVGNKPGVTKAINWLKGKDGITLMDTPGILWPKFDNATIALNLAVTGSIKNEILPIIDLANYLLLFYKKYYPNIYNDYYKLEDNMELNDMYEFLANKMGAKINGEIDYERIAMKIYHDMVNSKIKGVTFDYDEGNR